MKAIKSNHLDQLSEYVHQLYNKPELHFLFLELTQRCNSNCFHCGSSCGKEIVEQELRLRDYQVILQQVKWDFDIRQIQLCVTGGEPLLHPEFFEIMGLAHDLGYTWGMTSNGTLISRETAHRLSQCGMSTISISIDGLVDTHDRLRGFPGGYDLAMRGIQNLIEEQSFKAIQVTTVINHENIEELDELFDVMEDIDIDIWRVINIEPIGRACRYPDLMCTREDLIRLLDFVRQKRLAGYPVEYGCCHFLGFEYEREVRDWYWICNADIYTASIMSNGDIGACLDIERRDEYIQGNIRTDRLKDVWENRFDFFRRDLSDISGHCIDCTYKSHCRGDAHHSWDYKQNKPLFCYRDVLASQS